MATLVSEEQKSRRLRFARRNRENGDDFIGRRGGSVGVPAVQAESIGGKAAFVPPSQAAAADKSGTTLRGALGKASRKKDGKREMKIV
jgi:hypothetical protein